ncbi:histidine--tRNA ligase [Puniceibacterium sediminis]|uniref:Histidine--tRNA ligase n=1 Tax=Puniceibacterium sediminis TaxID=1608407 RepID=A0A238WUC5_9RHOB|nr:histidine--tRNA ligase [Puniceibacterium sediminis]SNR50150.1 histidyl-tRNA synthetase [Puniceibacterium sediminis]
MAGAKTKLNFAISGFPEFTPAVRDVERQWLATLAEVFESYGYANIETPSVETVQTLASKGEDVDKEIYALTRLAAIGENASAKLALHYDLTVPTARYVAKQHGNLTFPFKRYQMQRCWRGERPQEGRYREFTQCDIDVIDADTVSLSYDAEMLEMAVVALTRLNVGPVKFQVSNRKIMDGLAACLGLSDGTLLARILDKVDKLSTEQLSERLSTELGLDATGIDTCIRFCQIKGGPDAISDGMDALGLSNPDADAGRDALCTLLAKVEKSRPDGFIIDGDLAISRGFDYYTGVVYEARFIDFPGYPSICAGGRYENLVGQFMKRKLPGVGISIGLTRIFTKLLTEGLLETGRSTPTEVLVAGDASLTEVEAEALAAQIRATGTNVEILPDVPRLDKQLKYANDKGIPYVWIVRDGKHQLKDMTTGTQKDITVSDFAASRPN